MDKYPNAGFAQSHGSLAGGVVSAQAAPPVENALDQHEKSLSALVSHLENLAVRAEALADRLFGSTPKSVSENQKAAQNPPMLRRLEDLTSGGHSRLDALNDALNRLERL